MVSPRATLVAWSKEELEQLVAWMEENPEQLRGKQAVWHKDVKDQVFKNDEHQAFQGASTWFFFYHWILTVQYSQE